MAGAATLEFKPCCCIKMNTKLQLPTTDKPKESPVFLFMGVEWNIQIYAFGECYCACIMPKCIQSPSEFKPFQLDYSVELENEEKLSLGKGNVNIKDAVSNNFWSMRHNTLEQKLPSGNHVAGTSIKFMLRFHFSEETALEINNVLQGTCEKTVSSLCKDFSMMLESDLYHDVELHCGKQVIKAHKSILSARSKIFKEMLQSNMLEGQSSIVNIQDIDINCIQDFLKYLYTDTLSELTFDKAKMLYKVGDKYAVQSLMIRCSKYIQDNLSRENACECLALAETYCDEKLKDKVITYILKMELFLQEELWWPFCKQYPKIALHVYKLSYKNKSKN